MLNGFPRSAVGIVKHSLSLSPSLAHCPTCGARAMEPTSYPSRQGCENASSQVAQLHRNFFCKKRNLLRGDGYKSRGQHNSYKLTLPPG